MNRCTKLLRNQRNVVQELENQMSILVNQVCVVCCISLLGLLQNGVETLKIQMSQVVSIFVHDICIFQCFI